MWNNYEVTRKAWPNRMFQYYSYKIYHKMIREAIESITAAAGGCKRIKYSTILHHEML